MGRLKRKKDKPGIIVGVSDAVTKPRGFIVLDTGSFLVSLSIVTLGILLSYILEKRHILGKKGTS
jgi:hypothetical protein